MSDQVENSLRGRRGMIQQTISRRGSIAEERQIAKIRRDRPTNIAQLNNGIPRDLIEKEWKPAQLQNWNWSNIVPNHLSTPQEAGSNDESNRPASVHFRIERQPIPIPSGASSNDDHRRPPTKGSFSWPRPPGRSSELPKPSKIEEHLAQIPAPTLNRFYQNRDVDIILTGPENYAWWASNKKRQFIESNAWRAISEDLSCVPGESNYQVHHHKLFKIAWFGIMESVSLEIRRILNIDWRGNPRGAWALPGENVRFSIGNHALFYEGCPRHA
ncbi:hypothetical protein N7523_001257 [Penicillium sp. IBT 18751x]|nr:hypothetical protein N7523_001257 [Penicillium sp. IBT 18751x]